MSENLIFPGSSAVERPAVNRLVAGSIPARGALKNNPILCGLFFIPIVELELI